MTAIPAPLFSCPLGDDAVLIPRTALIADAYHALLMANHQRLARWEPWAVPEPTPQDTRAYLEAAGRNWLSGSELPVAIAVHRDDAWHLAGSVGLRIDWDMRAGEIGYWIDAACEGRGLVTRAVSVILDQAFGPLGLDRMELRTQTGNERSRALARRLGFTEEGLRRQAVAFPGERRDEMIYSLLRSEWLAMPGRA